MEPWACVSGLRRGAPLDDEQLVKNSRDPSIVTPQEYDDYAIRPAEPAHEACDPHLCVTVRDSHHPCAPYQSIGHSFAVEIYDCDGLPLVWGGVNFGAGVPLQVPGQAAVLSTGSSACRMAATSSAHPRSARTW